MDKRSRSPITTGFDLLLLEAPLGMSTLEPWNNLRRYQFVMVVISDREVESMVEGSGGFSYGSLGLVLINYFYDIPHSCLEYGMGVTG